jgi:hypothetical protein
LLFNLPLDKLPKITGNGGENELHLAGQSQSLDLVNIADADIQGIETIDITGSGDNTLTLDEEEVLNISPASDTLIVRHNSGDNVNYGDGWMVNLPSLFDGEFRHVMQLGLAVIQVVNTTPWQNPLLPLDSNRDGIFTPNDAILPINSLNRLGSRPLAVPTTQATLPEFYVDSNGDNFNTPNDVLLVINFLNSQTGNAEGESDVTHLDLAFLGRTEQRTEVGVVERDEDAPAQQRVATGPLRPNSSVAEKISYAAVERL